jgi:acetoacetyl-CoA synthetase
MVHSVGGTLLKHLEEHFLQECLTKDDKILFYTTTGWMMWNWLVTALATGAAIVLYDGSPFLPHPEVLFDLVDDIGITVLGMGAKCYSVYEDKLVRPIKTHRLTSLKAVLSTGSPLKPQSFDYIYGNIKKNLLIGSISGGTDIIACFMGASWIVPVHRGEIQVPYLGCHMQSWSEDGRPIFGERGELVCLKPFPSMPTHFLNDTNNIKYKKAYFDKIEGVWAHGDYCIVNPQTGGVQMLGRSDGTLNPGGVRFGSAEIYHVVEAFKEIADSLCVGQKIQDDDERVILFIKMKENAKFTLELENQLRTTIRQKLTPRHIPAVILQIADIPYTTSGKKVEIAVKQILAGETVLNRSALANPQSLDLYADLKELSVGLDRNAINNNHLIQTNLYSSPNLNV